MRVRFILGAAAFLFLASLAASGEGDSSVRMAQGTVGRVEDGTLIVFLRPPEPKPGTKVDEPKKPIPVVDLKLKVTGTSKLSILERQRQDGKTVFVQREAQLKDLKPGQQITVIYAAVKAEAVLLTAIVEPSAK